MPSIVTVKHLGLPLLYMDATEVIHKKKANKRPGEECCLFTLSPVVKYQGRRRDSLPTRILGNTMCQTPKKPPIFSDL